MKVGTVLAGGGAVLTGHSCQPAGTRLTVNINILNWRAVVVELGRRRQSTYSRAGWVVCSILLSLDRLGGRRDVRGASNHDCKVKGCPDVSADLPFLNSDQLSLASLQGR